jgi:LysM repeat protein
MAAVAHVSPAQSRRLAAVRAHADAAPTAVRTPATVYRRRRAVAGLVLVAAVTAVVLLAGGILASFAAPSTASSPVASEGPAAGAVYVVQPGDTFWAIARRLQPGGDPRPLVARLVAAHGSPALVTGERLSLPAGG